jgi:hypothetical protein
MYSIILTGIGRDGKQYANTISESFASVEAAILQAKHLASTSIFYWGKATKYRINDKIGRIVSNGSI